MTVQQYQPHGADGTQRDIPLFLKMLARTGTVQKDTVNVYLTFFYWKSCGLHAQSKLQ